jgi:hypothetical protein
MDRLSAARSIHLRIQQPLFDEIEEFRRGQVIIPSRPAAVLQLLQEA